MIRTSQESKAGVLRQSLFLRTSGRTGRMPRRTSRVFSLAVVAEMRRRALVGWDEPVYQGGKLVGHIRKFSDTLLIFALKAERPEKYRERYEPRSEGHTPVTLTLSIPRPPGVGLPEATEHHSAFLKT